MISFIVPAHDEERYLAPTLAALHAAAAATDERYEIIVVDDASSDATAAVAAAGGATVVGVNLRNISAVRNAGAREARGELLVFVDADTIVPPGVLDATIRAWRAGAVGGGSWARFEGRMPLHARLLEWAWRLLQIFFHLTSGCYIWASREAFERVAGFDEKVFVAEDADLGMRLKPLGRFVIVHEIVTTSGRSARTLKVGEALLIITRFALHGPKGFNRRWGPWYEPRRSVPGARRPPPPPGGS